MSGQKKHEQVNMRKGGKSLADYSDENFSMGNEQMSADNNSKNEGLGLNLNNKATNYKAKQNVSSLNGHKNSDGNAIMNERRMKYLNGSDNND
jgi:hypothetical protein